MLVNLGTVFDGHSNMYNLVFARLCWAIFFVKTVQVYVFCGGSI